MLDLSKLADCIHYEGGVSRRLFLAYAASLSSLPLLAERSSAKPNKPKAGTNPFQLGVASGDPAPDSVVLWTRLAPQPLEPHGGMEPGKVAVTWELAEDDAMRKIIRTGTASATPDLAHSIHAEVGGLAPDRWYWYRFRVGEVESPVGRTRTMPLADSLPDEVRFAFASCQHYETGYFTAYKHMVEEDLDIVFHLGDYIYEDAGDERHVRRHIGGKCETLADYRIRHSLYRSDPLLHAAHAHCPWLVTWDDHEVANDYANDHIREDKPDPAKFLIRRAAAYQAYYEMMPLRRTSMPRGPKMQLYRDAGFGRLANFLVLDERQYRTDLPNNGKSTDLTPECLSPNGTMLGKEQHEWVCDTLAKSPAVWNVLAQQVVMTLVDFKHGSEREFSMDKWSGYVDERKKLMAYIADHKVANPVVLTGDVHSNWVNDMRVDDLQPETPVVATEFVGTSISSSGDGGQKRERERYLMAENPGVKFFNQERGYVRCTVTPKDWTTDFRTVDYVEKPGAPVTTRAAFVVEVGQPGAKQA
jgi:alkaline phosphatase D